MVVTAVPVTEASAATGLPKAKTYYVGKSYTLNLTTPKSWKKVSTVWTKTNDKNHTITLKDKKAKSVRVKALERTIKKADTATVIAKVSYKKSGKAMKATYKCKVTVKRPAVSLSATKATVKVDESIELTAKYVPSYAEVSFEAEDSTVAVVEDLGNGKAKVTGVMPGKSTNIKAST
jgi:beta-galactosidase/beta-glucuronidase